MNISLNNTYNIENKKRNSIRQFPSSSAFKSVPDLSFKGVSAIKIADAVKIFGEEIGSSAAEHLGQTIRRVINTKNSGVKLIKGDNLEFAEDSFGKRLYRAIVDPIIYLPIDLANSTLNLIKKIPGLKNSKFIDTLRDVGPLKSRRDNLETFSNAMAIKHYFEILEGKDRSKLLKEAVKRFKVRQTEYSVKGERSLTRGVTGIIPAFFLANDAYNLSIYLNNDKDLAKKEKKKRFYQEVSRVAVASAATFATLGFFSKKISSDPAKATAILASLTFASELIGRMIVGTPFYPIGKKDAEKYAKLRNKEKLHKKNDDKNIKPSKSADKKNESKSSYALKLLGGMILAGFLIDKRSNIKPVRKFLSDLSTKYKEFFAKDYTISRKEFNEIVAELRKNGFGPLAQSYEKDRDRILNEGNLTAKELLQVEREFNRRVEKLLPDKLLMTSEELKTAQKEAKKKVNRDDVIKSFNFSHNKNEDIHISGDLSKLFKEGTNVQKAKDIIFNGILALPIKFAWEILNMPYQYVVKPLIEIPINIAKGKSLLKSEDKAPNDKEMFRKGVEFLRKNLHSSDFIEKVNRNIIDSFDNVNKSNLSSADLGGSAKVAVSTATSAFLILDNYNMVMIDSEGKDKRLAEQKAKERTLQRIVRIAYGACLIKLFNGIFKSQYDASLLGAQTVTTANTVLIESLERTSVGLPLHEATREEIIEKDNKALNATGLKGLYFRFMASLTGKKPISEKKNRI